MAKIDISLRNLITGGMKASIIPSFNLFIQFLQKSDGVSGIMADDQNLSQIVVPIVAAEIRCSIFIETGQNSLCYLCCGY